MELAAALCLVTSMQLGIAIAHRTPTLLVYSASPPRPMQPAKVRPLPPFADCADYLMGQADDELMNKQEDPANWSDTDNLADANTAGPVENIPSSDPKNSP